MNKRNGIIVIALIFLMLPCFTGCSDITTHAGKENEILSDTNDLDASGFQKEMNIVSLLRLLSFCKTEDGYYLQSDGLLYFMDSTTGKMIVVCNKPECSHNDSDCNAWINSPFLSYYQGKLYYGNQISQNFRIFRAEV